ncbi:nucleotidyltransferase family protein [Aurantiacibacter zhengii]|uniref:Nucleotidyltransferase family protein n=1 Tax=Aurantiacibacter zhengii TaxID=2307003 RepID=A0A418NMM7_9SPHN|nr:nucleotidyltransferase family protein [Aurantiacibacter zhengii]RIV82465.1 nucleotidyltransferase family protein [Aurantiacibacter zhengii]
MADEQPLVAVLAAGKASRFGGGKLDANLKGRPVGRWVLDTVESAGLMRRFIVTGPESPQFARDATGWQVIVNRHPERGLSGSVEAARRQAVAQQADLLLVLADMPLIEPGHLQELVATPGSTATRYPDGRLGVPALVRASDQDWLANLTGDRGAGRVLAEIPRLTRVDAAPHSLLDIDDAAGLEELRRRLG